VSYFVYVVELDNENFKPPNKFKKDNPHIWDESGGKISSENPKMFYVGQSAHDPECRFSQHKHCFGENIEHSCICGMDCTCCDDEHIITKNMSNSWVREHGLWLRKRMYTKYNPIQTYQKSLDLEQEITRKLKSKGYAAYCR